MRTLLIGSVFAITWASVASAGAEVYPSRSITMVVPVAAGGTIDTTARILAEQMRVHLGQPVVIENVTGAGGSIGTGRVARAEADGYTLIFGGLNTHVINAAILRLPYDVLEDFQPIALTSAFPLMVVAKKAIPASDLKQLIAWLAAKPSEPTVGTGGPGSPSHLAALLFQQQTGTLTGSLRARAALCATCGCGGRRRKRACPMKFALCPSKIARPIISTDSRLDRYHS